MFGSLLERRGNGDALVSSSVFALRKGGAARQPDVAMKLGACWRAVHLLADLVAGLPYDHYRRAPDGTGREIDPSPLVRAPSGLVSAAEWRYQLVVSLCWRGNAYAVITSRDALGYAATAEVCHPDEVDVRQERRFSPPTYRVNGEPVDRRDMIHVRAFGPTPGSVTGMSPLDAAAGVVGMGLAAEQVAHTFYAEGGHPVGILKSDQRLDDDGLIARIKERFKQATEVDRFAVLGHGLDYQAITATPQQAAFLEAKVASAAEAAVFFGVMPELIGLASPGGSSVTYANREQRALDFLAFTVTWWLRRIEALYDANTPRGQYVRANPGALLVTDVLTRYRAHDLALRGGWRSRDEIRRIEDEPPIPDGTGGEHLWPPYRTSPLPDEGVP